MKSAVNLLINDEKGSKFTDGRGSMRSAGSVLQVANG